MYIAFRASLCGQPKEMGDQLEAKHHFIGKPLKLIKRENSSNVQVLRMLRLMTKIFFILISICRALTKLRACHERGPMYD